MAAWTEDERAKIRQYLGRAPIFREADPLLESAMTAVQAQADGGSQPTSATQVLIQGHLTQLADIETRMQNLRSQYVALGVGQLTIDPVRALMALRMEGRRFVHMIAALLSTQPLRDVFAASPEVGAIKGHGFPGT
jgi:hypothetical protein